MPLSQSQLKSDLAAVFDSLPTSHLEAASKWDAAFQKYATAMPTTYGPASGPPLLLTPVLAALFSSFAGPSAVASAISAAFSATLAGGVTAQGSLTAPAAGPVSALIKSGVEAVLSAPPVANQPGSQRAAGIAVAMHAAFSAAGGLVTPPPWPVPPPPGSIIPS